MFLSPGNSSLFKLFRKQWSRDLCSRPHKFFSLRLNRHGPPWKTRVGRHVCSKVTKLAKMKNFELWASSTIQLLTWVGFSCINKSFSVVQSATNQHKNINDGIIKWPLSCACANIKATNTKSQSNTRRTTRHSGAGEFRPRSRVPLSWPWERGHLDSPHWNPARLSTAGKVFLKRPWNLTEACCSLLGPAGCGLPRSKSYYKWKTTSNLPLIFLTQGACTPSTEMLYAFRCFSQTLYFFAAST